MTSVDEDRVMFEVNDTAGQDDDMYDESAKRQILSLPLRSDYGNQGIQKFGELVVSFSYGFVAFIVSAIIIITIWLNREPKLVEEDEQLMKFIENYSHQKPIVLVTQVKKDEDCPTGFTPVPIHDWAGLIDACVCHDGNTNHTTSDCPNDCKIVTASQNQSPEQFNIWTGWKYCAVYSENMKYAVKGECSEGYKLCGQSACVPTSEPCPLSFGIQIDNIETSGKPSTPPPTSKPPANDTSEEEKKDKDKNKDKEDKEPKKDKEHENQGQKGEKPPSSPANDNKSNNSTKSEENNGAAQSEESKNKEPQNDKEKKPKEDKEKEPKEKKEQKEEKKPKEDHPNNGTKSESGDSSSATHLMQNERSGSGRFYTNLDQTQERTISQRQLSSAFEQQPTQNALHSSSLFDTSEQKRDQAIRHLEGDVQPNVLKFGDKTFVFVYNEKSPSLFLGLEVNYNAPCYNPSKNPELTSKHYYPAFDQSLVGCGQLGMASDQTEIVVDQPVTKFLAENGLTQNELPFLDSYYKPEDKMVLYFRKSVVSKGGEDGDFDLQNIQGVVQDADHVRKLSLVLSMIIGVFGLIIMILVLSFYCENKKRPIVGTPKCAGCLTAVNVFCGFTIIAVLCYFALLLYFQLYPKYKYLKLYAEGNYLASAPLQLVLLKAYYYVEETLGLSYQQVCIMLLMGMFYTLMHISIAILQCQVDKEQKKAKNN